MTLRNFLKLDGFILIIIGTAGLLLNEFAWEHTSTRTFIFAMVDLVGLITLGFAQFALKR